MTAMLITSMVLNAILAISWYFTARDRCMWYRECLRQRDERVREMLIGSKHEGTKGTKVL